MGIQYDAASHRYTTDEGRTLPSVTDIIKSTGLIDDTWFTDESRNRGSRVAQVTALDDLDILLEDTVEDEIRPYLDQWRRFLKESGWRVGSAERRVFSEVWGFAGTVDRIMLRNVPSGPAILDIKTGQPSPWHHIQTAAYSVAYSIGTPRYALYLAPTKYSLLRHEDSDDIIIFRAALTLHRWKETQGL
jgi:hypothetical protein